MENIFYELFDDDDEDEEIKDTHNQRLRMKITNKKSIL